MSAGCLFFDVFRSQPIDLKGIYHLELEGKINRKLMQKQEVLKAFYHNSKGFADFGIKTVSNFFFKDEIDENYWKYWLEFKFIGSYHPGFLSNDNIVEGILYNY